MRRTTFIPQNIIHIVSCLNALLLSAVLAGCADSNMTTVTYTKKVEVAPEKWLDLKQEVTVPLSDLRPPKGNPHHLNPLDGVQQFIVTSSPSGLSSVKRGAGFECTWNEKRVKWEGKEIPITVRELNGDLYMIGVNRENLNKIRFVFSKLNAEGNRFQEIEAKEFPPQIATQNLWLRAGSRHLNCDGELVDTWAILRKLDISHPVFASSYTAQVWYQIEKGVEYYKMPIIGREFLVGYVEKHKPIALSTIVKDDQKPTDSD